MFCENISNEIFVHTVKYLTLAVVNIHINLLLLFYKTLNIKYHPIKYGKVKTTRKV